MKPAPTSTGVLTRHRLYLAFGGLPLVGTSLYLLWRQESLSPHLRLTLALPLVLGYLIYAAAAHRLVMRQVQAFSGALGALREGDYSMRLRRTSDDSFGELADEINRLTETLQRQRRSETEATALLTEVMRELEVAIFAFDSHGKLRLANPRALAWLPPSATEPLGRTAESLGLDSLCQGASTRVLTPEETRLPGRWGLRRSRFYAEGRPHQLVLIADLSVALREEERQAWQRLTRVLTHELNNSLAPIKSIAGTLQQGLTRSPRLPDWEQDASEGLRIIESRAANLSRFTEAYATLARLPAPRLQPVRLPALLHRIRLLDTRLSVVAGTWPDLTLELDEAQVEQALINVLRNAIDAALAQHAGDPAHARVHLYAYTGPGTAMIEIEDNGPGLANLHNLFVPFFTTKPGGSGIGLALARQIIENHRGQITLRNREGAPGCRVVVQLPLA